MSAVRKAKPRTRLHTCEHCKTRAPWGKGWHYFPGVASDHDVTSDGRIFPVRFCSKKCNDLWCENWEREQATAREGYPWR